MPSSQDQARPFVFKVIWGALLLSQLFYGMVLVIVPPSRGGGLDPSALTLFLGIAAALAAGSLVLLTQLLNRQKIAEAFRDRPVPLALARLFVPYVLCWALNETVTLLGFVWAFLRAEARLQAFAPFLVAGLLLQILAFPRVDDEFANALRRDGERSTD
jgi:hypothetical protein